MKKKIYKILGVALTVTLLASLFAFAAPVSAAPDDLEWSKYPIPAQGALGGFFYDDAITAVGPIARAINGDLYAYAANATTPPTPAAANDIFKSTDGGRSWTVSRHPLFAYALVGGGPVVDIVCSSEDADVVYVADATRVYCSSDGGTTFTPLAPANLATVLAARNANQQITSLDVGYIGGEPYVFISTIDNTAAYDGSVYFVRHIPGFVLAWTDLNVPGATGWDFYSVNCPPNIETTSTIFAIVTNNTPLTQILTNSGTVGTWIQFGADIETLTTGGVDLEINGASNILFPGNFADDEVFVGICEIGGGGSVYRVDNLPAPCTFRLADPITGVPGADVWSLDVTGNVGATQLLAGAQDSTAIWYSNTDGLTWAAARKPPTGTGPTYVLMAGDFSTSGKAWAATSGDEGAVSLTIDGGDLWNQISLINTQILTIWDVSFYPDYATSGKLFMLTCDSAPAGVVDDSLWRFDGDYWERVAEEALFETLFGADVDMYMVEVSPDILTTDVVYFSGSYAGLSAGLDVNPNSRIFRTADEGQSWLPIACQLPSVAPTIVELNSWAIIDADTILAGGEITATGAGVVYKNASGGNRCWLETLVAEITGTIVDFAVYGDTVLCASDEGLVAISEDIGDSWDAVGPDLTDDADTCVAFDTDYDTNDTFYVVNDDDIYRCVIIPAPWFAQTFTDIDSNVALGANLTDVVTYNGCLYVSDDTASAGMWRSVNPTDDLPLWPLFEAVDVTFDFVADPPPPNFATAEIYWLDATGGEFPVIWALDRQAGGEMILWTFTDCLCCPVDLTSPADGTTTGRTDSVFLDWDDACFATCYDVWINWDPNFSTCCIIRGAADPCTGPDSCLAVAPIPSGTTFYWMVRVAPGFPLASKWSVAWSFTTQMGAAQWNPFQGPVTEYPYPGASDIPLRPTFAWNSADWASGYEFVLADNADFTSPMVEETVANPVYALGFDLEYSTTYWWKVRAVSATAASNWATGVFTTMARPVEVVPPPPPVEIPPTPAPISPAWIWAVVIIGAILVIAVIVLIVTTRRVP